MKKDEDKIYNCGVQMQWAAVRTILAEIRLPPQNHRILLRSPNPTAAMCGNSFGSAFVPPTISLCVFKAHSDMLIGL